MQLHDNSKIVFIGDSITDAGCAKPDGEGLNNALGAGYVNLVNALLWSRYPEKHLRVINKGLSGNQVRDLERRWQTDVLDLKPDWLSIMIGINDVWRQYDMPMRNECHVPLDEYAATLDRLVTTTQPTVKGLVLMTPFFIEAQAEDILRARMDAYGEVVRETAARHGAVFVDTQAAFSGFLAHYHSAALAWDRVHPNTTGHMLIARAWLNAVGFQW